MGDKKCAKDGCPNAFEDTFEGRNQAWRNGWYIQKWDGPAWCPDDIPEWVPSEFVRRSSKEPFSAIVRMSANLARKVLGAEQRGYFERASQLKSQWAEWRDSLTLEEKEQCVWAYVAAQSDMSENAMELLREQKPEIYKIYQEVQRGR